MSPEWETCPVSDHYLSLDFEPEGKSSHPEGILRLNGWKKSATIKQTDGEHVSVFESVTVGEDLKALFSHSRVA